MSADYSNPLTTILSIDRNPVELPLDNEPLEIIAQPCYTSKLRYRSDYEKNKNRRGALHSRNNPNYQSPAIRIPKQYLDITHQYYIRVCLVTVENEKSKCRYIHPYDLEDINMDDYNDRQNKAVWFPIQKEDSNQIKSFPNLRVVRKKVDDLKNDGDFRVFDSSDSAPQLSSVRDTIKEFNLDKAQLSFTIGQKLIDNDNIALIVYSRTTVFSDEMVDYIGRESDLDNVPTESTTVRSHQSESSTCRMYKYAPRNGYSDSNDEVLIFFNKKLKRDLQVTFEYNTSDISWSESVLDLQVKDQMVSFRTPYFPFPIENCASVDIILKQRDGVVLEPLKFDYIPIAQCPQCQRNAIRSQTPVTPTNSNKRRVSTLYVDDDELDNVIPICENRESNSAPETSFPTGTIDSVCLPLINQDPTNIFLNKLADGVASLFSNRDFLSVLRLCRPFIRKRPELLHGAISKNYSDLISNFIPVAGNDLLQQKNQLGETVLLHATRLNRVNIVKALLKRQNSDKLLEDTNDKKQNIFHILALNKDSDELLDLLIDHLHKNSIDITEKFDHVDQDNHTPLQLAILNNNLFVTRHFLKYFHTDLHVIDNKKLIYLAVLYDDLIRVE